MDTTIRYLALAIFLIVIFAVALSLSGGIPIGRGPGRGPILDFRWAPNFESGSTG